MKNFIITLFLFCTTYLTNAQTAEEIIEKHIAAIGGTENWKKVNSIKQEGAMELEGTTVLMNETILNGKGLRQDFSVVGISGFIIVTPTTGWNFMPSPGPNQEKPMAWSKSEIEDAQYSLDAQGNLIEYAAKGYSIEFQGKKNINGTDCFKLKLKLKTAFPQTIYIDSKTYLIVRITNIGENSWGKLFDGTRISKKKEYNTDYNNYEKLPEGIMVPKSVKLPSGEWKIKKITINGTVSESIFDIK